MLCAVGCGEQPSPRATGVAPTATKATAPADHAADLDADIAAAEATVRAYFAVKGRAEDPFSVRVDQQARYLTARDVHPAASYADGAGDLPSGITDQDVGVELSTSRRVGEQVLVDFAFESTTVSHPLIDGEMQETGDPGRSWWSGTATLEELDGVWLISAFTTTSSGGSVD